MNDTRDKDLIIKELRLSNKSLNKRLGILERALSKTESDFNHYEELMKAQSLKIRSLEATINLLNDTEIGHVNARNILLENEIKQLKQEIDTKGTVLAYSNAVRDQVLADKQNLLQQIEHLQSKLHERLDHTDCRKESNEKLDAIYKENQKLLAKLNLRKITLFRCIKKSIIT